MTKKKKAQFKIISRKKSQILLIFDGMVAYGWPADQEFLETWKSQGILWHLKNVREKSGNFVKFGKVREFYLREMNIAEVLHKNKLL